MNFTWAEVLSGRLISHVSDLNFSLNRHLVRCVSPPHRIGVKVSLIFKCLQLSRSKHCLELELEQLHEPTPLRDFPANYWTIQTRLWGSTPATVYVLLRLMYRDIQRVLNIWKAVQDNRVGGKTDGRNNELEEQYLWAIRRFGRRASQNGRNVTPRASTS